MIKLKDRFWSLLRSERIPRIIHQIWDSHTVPDEYREFYDSWRRLNPGWIHKLWTFREGALLLAQNNPVLWDIYLSFPHNVQRADLLRYFLLYHFGGFYVDMDCECVRPLEPLIQGGCDFVAGYENKKYASVCNAVLASSPGHSIWQHFFKVIKEVAHDRIRPNPGDITHVFEITGSTVLTPLVLAHRNKRTKMMPVGAFYPFCWDEKHRCKESFPDAYIKHYWNSGWIGLDGKYVINAYWKGSPPSVSPYV